MASYASPWDAYAAAAAAPSGTSGFRTLDPASAVAVNAGAYTVSSVTAAPDGTWTVTGLSDSGVPGTTAGCMIYWFLATEGTWGAILTAAAQISGIVSGGSDNMGVGIVWGNNTNPAAGGYVGRTLAINVGNGSGNPATWGLFNADNNAALTVAGGSNLLSSIYAKAWLIKTATNVVRFIGGVVPNGLLLKIITTSTVVAGVDPAYVGIALFRTAAASVGVKNIVFKPQVT